MVSAGSTLFITSLLDNGTTGCWLLVFVLVRVMLHKFHHKDTRTSSPVWHYLQPWLACLWSTALATSNIPRGKLQPWSKVNVGWLVQVPSCLIRKQNQLNLSSSMSLKSQSDVVWRVILSTLQPSCVLDFQSFSFILKMQWNMKSLPPPPPCPSPSSPFDIVKCCGGGGLLYR